MRQDDAAEDGAEGVRVLRQQQDLDRGDALVRLIGCGLGEGDGDGSGSGSASGSGVASGEGDGCGPQLARGERLARQRLLAHGRVVEERRQHHRRLHQVLLLQAVVDVQVRVVACASGSRPGPG